MADAKRLVAIYREVAGRVRTALLAVDPGAFTPTEAAKAMAEVQAWVAGLNEASVRWAEDAVRKSFDKGARQARAALEILGKKQARPPTDDPASRLIKDLSEILIKANNSILVTAEGYLTATSMAAKVIVTAQVQEFPTAEAHQAFEMLGQQAVKTEISRKTLAGQVRAHLASYISSDNIIEVGGKRWRADRYADMVSRTALRQAQTEATLDVCRQFENDLVEWSDHDTACTVGCEDYEGNVYSISGKHPTYPMLEATPPLHPNCEHSLLPTTDVALDLRKEGMGKAGWLSRATWVEGPRIAARRAATRQKKEKRPRQVDPNEPWRPATTIKEAEQWAKDHLCSGPVNYKACDLEVANLINKELDVIRQFGYKLDRIRPTDSKAIMYVWRHQIRLGPATATYGPMGQIVQRPGMIDAVEMTYNPRFMKDMQTLRATMERLDRSGLILAQTPEGLVRHELGHALDDMWMRANAMRPWQQSRSDILWRNWVAEFPASSERWAAEKYIQNNLSGSYMWCNRKGGQKNVQEFFAEAYRLYRNGSLPANMETLKQLFISWGW